ncbi:MAG TPA: nuclease-related domain-containing protein [Actinomycetota bacterium]|nr:nuclease-related domain-containing protein [Actinomycetota bacterium]
MALGTAGHRLRRNVNRMLVALAIVSVGGVVLAVGLGAPIASAPVLFIVSFLLILFWSPEERVWLANQRKGAIGEETVGRALAELEAEGFRVIHGLDTGRGDIDHVVVGPTGVFAIETKAWRGRVSLGPGGRLRLAGHDQERTIGQVMAEALEVKRRLADAGIRAFVEAVVVLTATHLPKGPVAGKHATVIELGDLGRFLRERPVKLSSIDVSRIVGAIYRNGGTITARAVSYGG